MPDYIYLLEHRLSNHQQGALRLIAQAAQEAGMNVFLVGGAVRDLASGSPVRDLDVAVQGNALKLKKPLEKSGAKLWGEVDASRTLFLRFPVGVTVEISSTRYDEYPKPGKAVYHWSGIHEDLRRRDFTANAMALSLNERSYGLLLDPLNGIADIESRLLRLVSNYGFLDDPSRLLRATRLTARLGWEMEERTRQRFDYALEENAIANLSSYQKGYELEEIGHEEDGLRILATMEAAHWMEHLFPAWTTARADAPRLEALHQLLTQLQMQGINPDTSAASMQLLTAKLPPKQLAALKKSLVRPGFVEEWNHLDSAAKEFSKHLTGKEAAIPSAAWKLFHSADPQAVLWLGLTSKAEPVQAKYRNLFSVWPEARQKIPHALLQELRITPEIPGYEEMLHQLFLGVIDGKLETEEQLRAFLEPYSPPAPPAPVIVRRGRASRKSAEPKIRIPDETEEAEDLGVEADDSGEEDAGDDEENGEVEHVPAASLAKKKVAPPKSAPAAKTAPETKTEQTKATHPGKGEEPAAKKASGKAASNSAPPSTGTPAKPTAKPAAKAHPAAGPKPTAVKGTTAAKAPAIKQPARAAAPPAKSKAHKPVKLKPAAKVQKKVAPAKKSRPASKPAPASKRR